MPEVNALTVLAVPFLLSLMVVENAIRKHQGLAPYSQRQTLNNLGVFVGWRAIIASLGLVPLWGYDWMFGHLAAWQMDPSEPWVWVLGFFLVDFVLFMRHWAAHRVSILWAMHAVHHQSREYNLSAAARLSWFSDTILIGIPLATMGLPIEVTSVWFILGNAWMLFQHTETIGKLGPLDEILVTPSNHRVHHGCNDIYLDKNFGSLLLVWDRLFGTFEREAEQVRYGVLTGLRTYDATENNLEPLRALIRRMRAAPSLASALQTPWRPPGWVPGENEEVAVMIDDPEPQRAVKIPQRIRHISTALITVTMLIVLALVWNVDTWPAAVRGPLALTAILGVAISGVVLDARPVAPVPATGSIGRARAQMAALLFTLAGPYAEGPIHRLAQWIVPGSSPSGSE